MVGAFLSLLALKNTIICLLQLLQGQGITTSTLDALLFPFELILHSLQIILVVFNFQFSHSEFLVELCQLHAVLPCFIDLYTVIVNLLLIYFSGQIVDFSLEVIFNLILFDMLTPCLLSENYSLFFELVNVLYHSFD